MWWCSYTNAGVRIATNSYTYKEVEILGNVLKSKFNLDIYIQKINIKDRYSLYIKKNSINILRELVLPYFHFSMYYKVGIINK